MASTSEQEAYSFLSAAQLKASVYRKLAPREDRYSATIYASEIAWRITMFDKQMYLLNTVKNQGSKFHTESE